MIAALVTDPTFRGRLTAATRARAAAANGAPGARGGTTEPIRWCRTPDELYAAVADEGAATAIVELTESFTGRDRHGDDVGLSVVQRLHDNFPTVAVLVYAAVTPVGFGAALKAGNAGAVDVIIADQDDLGRGVVPLLAKAESTAIARRATTRVREATSRNVAAILAYALDNARFALSVETAAFVLGVRRKTLAQWCAQSGAPVPGALLTWGRLVVAAELLSDPGRSAEQVAVACAFPSGSALANTLRRWTGLTRAAILEAGGGIVLEMLVRRLENGAAGARARGRASGAVGRPRVPALALRPVVDRTRHQTPRARRR